MLQDQPQTRQPAPADQPPLNTRPASAPAVAKPRLPKRAPVEVTLENGQVLTSGRVLVRNTDGSTSILPLARLKPGVFVEQPLGGHVGEIVTLTPVRERARCNTITTPAVLDADLACMLGFLAGNGTVGPTGRAVSFSLRADSPALPWLQAYFAGTFGLASQVYPDKRSSAVKLNVASVALREWLEANGLSKLHGHSHPFPEAVMKSPPPVIGAFIGGLLEADGHMSYGRPVLCSTSEKLVRGTQQALASIGVPATIRYVDKGRGHYGTRPVLQLDVRCPVGLERFIEQVIFVPGSRFQALRNTIIDPVRASAFLVPHGRVLLEQALAATRREAGRDGQPSEATCKRRDLRRLIKQGSACRPGWLVRLGVEGDHYAACYWRVTSVRPLPPGPEVQARQGSAQQPVPSSTRVLTSVTRHAPTSSRE